MTLYQSTVRKLSLWRTELILWHNIDMISIRVQWTIINILTTSQVLSFTFIECQLDLISDKITISLCLIIPVQFINHSFHRTLSTMFWTEPKKHEIVNQSIRLETQTVDGLDSDCEGTSAISDENDALKNNVISSVVSV